MKAGAALFRLRNTWRLIPTRYPSTGILDRIAEPADLDAIIELESWTNDRVSADLGLIHRIPREEWVTGRPMSSVIMASYCHPHPQGGRFNLPDRGAWYAATTLETAQAEVAYHRTRELAEIGVWDVRVEFRAYLADFRARFHDLRGRGGAIYSKTSYSASQTLTAELLAAESNGVVYDSVRHAGGTCLACFRPKLVANVRAGAHYEMRWSGSRIPAVRRLG